MTQLTVVVLTYNEESNLGACLASVDGLGARVLVVDSGSRDRTVELARSSGAIVLEHPFESHAAQWAWALANLPEETEWVLGIDADQRLSPELRDELFRLRSDAESMRMFDGFYVCRRQIFRGRWIRHGTYYPKYLLKLFRPTRVRFDSHDLVDHHFFVDGPTRTLHGDLIEENRKEDDITFWIDKHARYAVLHAREEYARRNGDARWVQSSAVLGTPDQRTIWIKRRWHMLPLYVRPAVYFAYRYVIRLGFLDGKQGFVFHFLHAFWYRLLVDIHLDDLRRQSHVEASR